MAELEPKKKKAKVKPEVSVEEALEEKGAKWAKGREVPAVDDESESYSYEDYSYEDYSYEEEEDDCSVDWGRTPTSSSSQIRRLSRFGGTNCQSSKCE